MKIKGAALAAAAVLVLAGCGGGDEGGEAGSSKPAAKTSEAASETNPLKKVRKATVADGAPDPTPIARQVNCPGQVGTAKKGTKFIMCPDMRVIATYANGPTKADIDQATGSGDTPAVVGKNYTISQGGLGEDMPADVTVKEMAAKLGAKIAPATAPTPTPTPEPTPEPEPEPSAPPSPAEKECGALDGSTPPCDTPEDFVDPDADCPSGDCGPPPGYDPNDPNTW